MKSYSATRKLIRHIQSLNKNYQDSSCATLLLGMISALRWVSDKESPNPLLYYNFLSGELDKNKRGSKKK